MPSCDGLLCTMPKRWRIATLDIDRIASLERSAGIPNVVAKLLVRRGIDNPLAARQFLDCKLSGLHPPQLLPGATDAARLIAGAIAAKERIVIYGDYDADGMTGTAILLLCLQMLDANVHYYIPSRLEEGYGLSTDALEKLAAEGTQLVISVDCGIASVAEAEAARRLGMKLVISDHHEMAAKLPAADVLVHPRLPGSKYPFAGICGAGVALKIAWAICQHIEGADRVSPRLRNFLMRAVGLAAIGTVADVVPLVDENRLIVRHGTRALRDQPTLGMAELARVTGLHEKPYWESEDIAFTIAPRLNAAGRLGQAQLAIELMTTTKPDRATALAQYIHELNESRQSLERSIFRSAHKQALEQFDPTADAALVLADHDWHVGVIGIVAGRLTEKYHRPTVLIALDPLDTRPGTGSARSIPGFNLHEALTECSDHLVGYGGHAMAAGLRIERTQIDAFRTAFCEYATEQLTAEVREAELHIDAEAPFSTLNEKTVSQLESLAPFGAGNDRPLLCTHDVRIDGEVRRIGGGGRHLSLTFNQHGLKLRAVAFGGGDWEDDLAGHDGPMSIAFRPVINTFRGRRSVEMHLTDWKPAK